MTDSVRAWLVERTYSDDEQNIIILIYATPDGEQYFRMERAVTSPAAFPEVTVAVDAEPPNLGAVEDPDTRERYAAQAERMAGEHDPDDVV